ncbi:PAS domain S-box-containing protein [Motilibacter rhizosphaerae]|uniref:PAS domain S-box-containing protein n=1 Tax=Motilibacter rhizosphaerae TaxID=598652 RepID=A0A4Q7NP79_9ACTN|nr:SpoIIE family protein phosphatase [Motilibacter rhizosphaerae]RZS86828.1 PAS domain S-box-containing protein [Motilibacter rhizosphaerae]
MTDLAAHALAGDPERVAAARRIVPPGGGSAALDRLAALAARLLRAPSSQVSLIADVQHVVGVAGRAERGTGPREDSLCTVTAGLRAPLRVEDAADDARVSALPPVTTGAVRSYLGVPLVDSAGRVLGALCVYGPEHRTWSDDDVAVLEGLAEPVVAQLELTAVAAEYARSRLRLDLALSAADIGSFEWDLTTGELDWDDRLLAVFGLDPERPVVHIDAFWAHVLPADRAGLERDIAAAVGSCGDFSSEYRITRPDGALRWVHARGSVVCGDDGRPQRLLGAAYDSTEARDAGERAARVIDTMAVGFFSVDRQWRVTYVNAEGERILGRRSEELLGRDLWEEFPGAREARFGRAYLAAVEDRVEQAFEEHYPGLDAWFEVRARPTADGLSVYFLDITARRSAERALERTADRMRLLARVSADLTTLELDEALQRLAVAAVPVLADWAEVTLVDAEGRLEGVASWHAERELRPVVEEYLAARLPHLQEASYVRQALLTGEPQLVRVDARERLAELLPDARSRELLDALAPATAVFLPLRARGRTLGLLDLYAGPARGPLLAEELDTLVELADRAGLAADNAAAYQRAREAADQAATASRRLALLARGSEALSTTLDAGEAAARLARLVVPQLGEWSLVVGRLDGPELRVHASTTRDPGRGETVTALGRALAASTAAESPVQTSLRTGHPAVASGDLRDGLGDEVADLLAQLDCSALVAVPLVARGRALGALVVGPDVPLTPDELDTAAELARRAALALDNALLYDSQRTLAEQLQRSLLTDPPQPDHLQLAVRYTPASEEAQVGGDWYDAFLQPDGTTVLVIGDVVGHDTRAAAAMGQVRGLLRGIAYTSEAGPADVLSRLDAALEGLQVGTTATAVVARLEQTDDERERQISRIRWSNAGHPPPMVINPDGVVSLLAGIEADLLLGIDPSATRTEWEAVLDRGSTVLLYTDGLVERRGQSLEDGLVDLREALTALGAEPLEALCDAVLARLLPPDAEDDVALVAVRLHRTDGPAPVDEAAGEGSAGAQ